jgi:hypothetical protein
MRKGLAALIPFLAAALWTYLWEFVRSWIYERVLGMIEPYIPPYDTVLHYGPPLALVAVGIWLFYSAKTSPRQAANVAVIATRSVDVEGVLISKLRNYRVEHPFVVLN